MIDKTEADRFRILGMEYCMTLWPWVDSGALQKEVFLTAIGHLASRVQVLESKSQQYDDQDCGVRI